MVFVKTRPCRCPGGGQKDPWRKGHRKWQERERGLWRGKLGEDRRFPLPFPRGWENLPGQHLEWENCPWPSHPRKCLCTHVGGPFFLSLTATLPRNLPQLSTSGPHLSPSSNRTPCSSSCSLLPLQGLWGRAGSSRPSLPPSRSSPWPGWRNQHRGGRGQPHPGGAPGSWQSQLEPLEADAE